MSYERLGTIIRSFVSVNTQRVKLSHKSNSTPDFKMVYFVGEKGLDFLNASLYSVYKNFNSLPELIIVSDGTPTPTIEKRMVKWPVAVDIIQWNTCAEYFKNKGNDCLYKYATEDLWGKKLTAILYCAEHYKTLYSDTDVLWFADPTGSLNIGKDTFMKMSLDEDFSYAAEMVLELGQDYIYKTQPFNAGIIYAKGDFSSFPQWNELTSYLADLKSKTIKKRGWTEQTAFAILNNYFGTSWSKEEVLIEIDDHKVFLNKHARRYTKIFARHYVTTKGWLFWRDFLYYIIVRKGSSIIFPSRYHINTLKSIWQK